MTEDYIHIKKKDRVRSDLNKMRENERLLKESAIVSAEPRNTKHKPCKKGEPLDRDEIREIVFSNYSLLVDYASRCFVRLTNSLGTPATELVNEAIINIFDVVLPFTSKGDVMDYLQTAINSEGFHQHETLKKNVQMGTKNSFIKDIPPSAEFLRVYAAFEDARFGKKNEEKFCIRCGTKRFYQYRTGKSAGLFKCTGCGRKMSLTTRTYLHGSKLPYSKIYKLVCIICKNPKERDIIIARKVKIMNTTATLKGRLIRSIINAVGTTDIVVVFNKLFTPVQFDKTPVKTKAILYGRNLTDEHVVEIRRLINDSLCRTSDVAKLYGMDVSHIRKIAKGVIYKKTSASVIEGRLSKKEYGWNKNFEYQTKRGEVISQP